MNDAPTAMVFTTPDEIAYFRITSIKGRLKMEKAGLKFRGPALRPMLAKEFGLRPRDSHEKYIAYCEMQQTILLARKSSSQAPVPQSYPLRGGNPS